MVAKSTFFIAFLVFLSLKPISNPGDPDQVRTFISHPPGDGQANGGTGKSFAGDNDAPLPQWPPGASGRSPALHLPAGGLHFTHPPRMPEDPAGTLIEMRAICLTVARHRRSSPAATATPSCRRSAAQERRAVENEISDESIFDLFRNQSQPDRQVAVNRYLWQASLDVLSFLPIEGADPFSGLLVTGWGRVGERRRASTGSPSISATRRSTPRRSRSRGSARPAGGRCRSTPPPTARSRTRS